MRYWIKQYDPLLEQLNDQWLMEDRLRPDAAPMPRHAVGFHDFTKYPETFRYILRQILKPDSALQFVNR